MTEPDFGRAAPTSDAIDRERIASDLDSTLFVEAGAGAGKTTALAGRIVALVEAGVRIGAIAAITFTEKAAAELRHKTRERLASAATGNGSADPQAARRCRAAIDELETAAIGTLHAFAARLLREFPIEAGLPPNFGVLDEVASDLAFEERWSAQLVAMLDDPERARLVEFARVDGIGFAGLRRIARSFGDGWDLVEQRVERTAAPPTAPDVGPIIAAIDAIVAATDPPVGDKVAEWLDDARRFAEQLRRSPSEFTLFEVSDRRITTTAKIGNAQNWKSNPTGLADFRSGQADLREAWLTLVATTRSGWQRALGADVAGFTLARAAERRQRGELEFHDLLVIARRLIAEHSHVRHALHRRYERLLIDEFQDTDSVQLDIAIRIAASPDLPSPSTSASSPAASATAASHDLPSSGRPAGVGAADQTGDDCSSDGRVGTPAPGRQHDLVAMPGRLFFVGDPKQSIYRFRRADIAQYLRAADAVGAEQLALTTNFRSTPAVLAWVNHTFGRLIVEQPDSQPAYRPLDQHRRDHPGSAGVLGYDEHPAAVDGRKTTAHDVRRFEADDIAATIVRALDEGWTVSDDSGTSRACRMSDIAILLPSRLSLAALTEALRGAGVPFQAENASVVYATAEIRQLMLALRALDDATDALALVNVLRSPLFGCSDVDLYRWRAAGGNWRADIAVDIDRQPALASNPVLGAMQVMHSWSSARHWSTPSELLGRIVNERRVLELALNHPGARDTWRRVRFVIDQARAWAEAGGVGLRNYLAWTRRQGEDGRYVAEAILPETDIDAVRIMTIHAAKGLEFPITIVGGMTAKRPGLPRHAVVWTRNSWTLKSGSDYEAFQPLDEQLDDHERLRLLYVACTRARDHLVVSLHRLPVGRSGPTTAAQILAKAALDAPVSDPVGFDGSGRRPKATAPNELPWADGNDWAAERQRALSTASRPSTLSPSRLVELVNGAYGDPALAKDPVDLELPAWQRGRYGTSVGRAVHGVLQSVDLLTAADLDPLATSQTIAEGLGDRVRLVAALARSALATPIVQAAAAGAPHWRELFVAAPIGETLVEGYIDLLVRTPDGLVIVDYKTDHIADDTSLDAKVDRYRTQLAAYALAVESVTGEPVIGARLVFCRASGAIEQPVPDWTSAVAALRHRLETGQAPPMSDDAAPDPE